MGAEGATALPAYLASWSQAAWMPAWQSLWVICCRLELTAKKQAPPKASIEQKNSKRDCLVAVCDCARVMRGFAVP